MATLLDLLITELRRASNRPVIDPLDKSAPPGTIRRRIDAYNALRELAVAGRDRYCGAPLSGFGMDQVCILKDGHRPSLYDPSTPHMGVEMRDRAERYLVHSEPDPARRA